MIELLTAATPNGHKVSIMLEELNIEYSVRAIDLGAQEQKQDWFLKLNPNGRIPVIIDHDNDDFAVFESGAILIYLAEKYDQFLPRNPKQRSITLQWLMFQMGGVGPMQGQAVVFSRHASEHIPYAIERYQNETQRLYAVLEHQLQQQPFLANDYSIADIAMFPWVYRHDLADISLERYPQLQTWLNRIEQRPKVQQGLAVPQPRQN